MNIKLPRATALALLALLTPLPQGCDDEETNLDPIGAITKGEKPDETEPIPPPPDPAQQDDTKATGEDESPPDQAVVPPKVGATEAPTTDASPAAGEEAEAVVTTSQGQTADTMANQDPPANPAATVRIFLSNDNNPDFGYIVAAQLDAWMPGETPACKARFESWTDKRRSAYNKRLEGIVRYLVYHISDSFKTQSEVYGGKLDGEDVEAMTEDDLREWLSGEPTRLELYAIGRWHLPHNGATVPVRFGGKPKTATDEPRAPEAPATELPKGNSGDTPPHAPEPETPQAPDSEAPPKGDDAPAPPAPEPSTTPAPDNGTPSPGDTSPPASPPAPDPPAPAPAPPSMGTPGPASI